MEEKAKVVTIEKCWSVEFICPMCRLTTEDKCYGGKPSGSTTVGCGNCDWTGRLDPEELAILRKAA